MLSFHHHGRRHPHPHPHCCYTTHSVVICRGPGTFVVPLIIIPVKWLLMVPVFKTKGLKGLLRWIWEWGKNRQSLFSPFTFIPIFYVLLEQRNFLHVSLFFSLSYPSSRDNIALMVITSSGMILRCFADSYLWFSFVCCFHIQISLSCYANVAALWAPGV